MRTFLIDTDTASDDAVALIMALRSPQVRVAAITVVAGNVPLAQATSNALYTAELCGSDTPVYSGAKGPLLRPLQLADWFHGKDGLGDHGYKPSRNCAESGHAADIIIETVRKNRGIEIVTLGPLTNLAMALLREPTLAANVHRCIIMGGNPVSIGNVTPAAEFNIWVDPDAARIVFRSGLPIELVGWHLCRGEAVLSQRDIDRALALRNSIAEFAIRCNSVAAQSLFTQTGETGICLPDPVCMGIALDPSLCASSTRHYIEIETQSELTRGMTIIDQLNVADDARNRHTWAETIAHQPNRLHVCWTLDVSRWKELLFSALA